MKTFSAYMSKFNSTGKKKKKRSVNHTKCRKKGWNYLPVKKLSAS